MKSWSALPRGTTLVSPVTMETPARSAAARIDSTTRRSTATSSPSSRMKAAESASGSAPPTARSLTVPLTASSPMSPPGKKSGLTTKESVLIARRAPSRPRTVSCAWSPSSSSTGLERTSAKSARTRVWLALPPAPWLMVIAVSRSDGLRLRISAMRASTRCSGSAIRAVAARIAAPLPACGAWSPSSATLTGAPTDSRWPGAESVG